MGDASEKVPSTDLEKKPKETNEKVNTQSDFKANEELQKKDDKSSTRSRKSESKDPSTVRSPRENSTEESESKIEKSKTYDRKIKEENNEKDVNFSHEKENANELKEKSVEKKTELIVNSEPDSHMANDDLKSEKSFKSSSSRPASSYIRSPSAPLKPFEPKTKELTRLQSEILPPSKEKANGLEEASAMIFSNKGVPSRRYLKRREVNSTVLPFGFNTTDGDDLRKEKNQSGKDSKTPSATQSEIVIQTTSEASDKKLVIDKKSTTSVCNMSRNILIGTGVSSQDEYRCKSARRKDGNPVTGLGYEDQPISHNSPRVPPGGFSKGLW